MASAWGIVFEFGLPVGVCHPWCVSYLPTPTVPTCAHTNTYSYTHVCVFINLLPTHMSALSKRHMVNPGNKKAQLLVNSPISLTTSISFQRKPIYVLMKHWAFKRNSDSEMESTCKIGFQLIWAGKAKIKKGVEKQSLQWVCLSFHVRVLWFFVYGIFRVLASPLCSEWICLMLWFAFGGNRPGASLHAGG